MTNLLRIVGILGLASLVYAQPIQPSAAALAMRFGSGFESKFAQVNGTRLHYVRGGRGPAIILLHGFPEDWYEFRLVMPRLAKTSRWWLWTSGEWANRRHRKPVTRQRT